MRAEPDRETLDSIDTILRDRCGLERDRPILVGVSGGPDSLCLLSMLHETGWRMVAAHFNHGLRDEADAEAAAVEALASGMRIPFVGERGDVRQHAHEQRLSIETAARELRYRFLFQQARWHGAQAVAVGHTADDQVETVLMHFLRGAGLNGLKGMTHRSLLREYDAQIPVVRPLLDLWRADTVAWCAAHGLEPHYDRSNESGDFLRNRVRNELIPALEGYNPRFREAAWRAAKTLAADHELLAQALEPPWQRCLVKQAREYICLDAAALQAQPEAAQMHLVQRAARLLVPDIEIDHADLQRAAALIAEPMQEQADLTGGLALLREGGVLYVAAGQDALPADQWPQMPAGQDSAGIIPPTAVALASGWSLAAEFCDAAEAGAPASWQERDPFEAFLDAGCAKTSLEARVRRAGDRFEPLGMAGHSLKLSDFFVNVKLPRRARERWPLLCAGEAILWVPGYRPADACRVRPETRKMLHLRLAAPAE